MTESERDCNGATIDEAHEGMMKLQALMERYPGLEVIVFHGQCATLLLATLLDRLRRDARYSQDELADLVDDCAHLIPTLDLVEQFELRIRIKELFGLLFAGNIGVRTKEEAMQLCAFQVRTKPTQHHD